MVPPTEQNEPGSLTNKASGDVWYVPSNYATIQDAINAATGGETIIVAAGEYDLSNTIVIDEQVKIYGAQRDIDPRPSTGGRSGDETILRGSMPIFDIKAHDVEINGFKIESIINNSLVNIIQDIDTSFNSQNATVRYNIITNQGSTMNEAVKIRVGTSPLIAYNYIDDIPSPGDAINFDRVTNGVIAFNEVRNSGSENAAIYVYSSLNTTIEGNLVDTTSQNDGIKLGNKGGDDEAESGGSILDNVVRNTKQDGISVYMSDVLVQGNEVSGSTSENGAIYLAYGISNITIEENTIYDNNLNTGKWGNPAGILIGTAVNASSVTINNNDIYNNDPNGVTNKATANANVDATCNWWGDDSGPSGNVTDPVTGTVADGSGDVVSTKVNFDPWIDGGEAPVIGIITINQVVVEQGTPISLTADFTGPIGGIATIDWGDGISEIASVSDGTVTGSHTYTEAGVYTVTVTLTITNECGSISGTKEYQYVVVYDPSGGFVTGGGWIDSPEGAYISDASLTGPANFGFVSKYKKGQSEPTGNTEFKFKAGNLNFQSDSYEWLVIAKAKAMYKGTGTINGNGDYGFMLSAIDEKLTPSTDVDLFRIKIWNKSTSTIIYDNQVGDEDDAEPATAISGGQIVIHK